MLVLLLLLTTDVHADIGNGQAVFDSKTLEDIADIVIRQESSCETGCFRRHRSSSRTTNC